jgi:hypothetical protein
MVKLYFILSIIIYLFLGIGGIILMLKEIVSHKELNKLNKLNAYPYVWTVVDIFMVVMSIILILMSVYGVYLFIDYNPSATAYSLQINYIK